MAKRKQAKPSTVTRYSPAGTKVTVSEEQAKKLRGYTANPPGEEKPKPTRARRTSPPSDD